MIRYFRQLPCLKDHPNFTNHFHGAASTIRDVTTCALQLVEKSMVRNQVTTMHDSADTASSID